MYESCLSYFGIGEQKQTLTFANRFIALKIFSLKNYIHLRAIYEAFLSVWLRYLRNMCSERINQPFRGRVNNSLNQCFECSNMPMFQSRSESSHCPGGEDWSVFCLLLWVCVPQSQLKNENQPFAWKCCVREYLLLDLAYHWTAIQSTAV